MDSQIITVPNRIGIYEMLPPILRYLANAVSFDGTNDYLTRDAGLTGASDSKLVTGSLWIRKQGADGVGEVIFSGSSVVGGGIGTQSFRANKDATNGFTFLGTNAAAAVILNLQSSANVVEIADGWVNLLYSFDMATSSNRHIYVNDSPALAVVTTYTNDTLAFVQADYSLAARPDGTAKLQADISDFWFNPGTYLDFSQSSNRRLFISADLKPVNLGTSGSVPIGTAPLVFFSGPTSAWETNKGSGGGFTERGALTSAPTTPSG